jgi:hypothetical protein
VSRQQEGYGDGGKPEVTCENWGGNFSGRSIGLLSAASV